MISNIPKTPFLSSGGGRSFLFFLAFESSDIKKSEGGVSFSSLSKVVI